MGGFPSMPMLRLPRTITAGMAPGMPGGPVGLPMAARLLGGGNTQVPAFLLPTPSADPQQLQPPPQVPGPQQAQPQGLPASPKLGVPQLLMLLLAGGRQGLASGLLMQQQMKMQRDRLLSVADTLPEDLRPAYIADPETFMKEYSKNFGPLNEGQTTGPYGKSGGRYTAPKIITENGRVGSATATSYTELGNTGPSIEASNGLVIDQRGLLPSAPGAPPGVVGAYATPQQVKAGDRPGSFTPTFGGLPPPPGSAPQPQSAPASSGAQIAGPVADMIRSRAAAAGLDESGAAMMLAFGKLESSLNPKAPKNGSSTGLYQFHPETFAALGGSDINDPVQQTDAAIQLAHHNADALNAAGVPVSPTSLYLAHQQGIAGAKALYSADPKSSAVQAIAPIYIAKFGDQKGLAIARQAIVGNGGSADMTTGQFLARWGGKVAAAMSSSAPGQNGAPAAPQDAQAPQAGQGNPPGWDVAPDPFSFGQGGGGAGQDIHGDDYLKTIPSNLANQVKALAEGRMQFPGSFALKQPYWQQMLQAVSQYDPNFDAVNFNARAATRKAFTSGAQSKNLANLNTVVNHLASLHDAIGGLRNFTGMGTLLNGPANAIYGATDPAFQRAIAKFNDARGIVSSDLVSALTGGGGGMHDREYWLKQFDPNKSPDSLYSAAQEAAEMINSRVDPMRENYQQGMGTTDDPFHVMFPKAAANLERLRAGAVTSNAGPKGPAAVQEGSVAVGPNGHRIVFKAGGWRDAATGAAIH